MRSFQTAVRLIVFAALALVIARSEAFAQSRAPESFRVEVTGRGRPMMLIPGLASPGDVWKTTVARYKDRYECHVVTLAGFAGAPPIAKPSLATVRAELTGYIRDHHLDHPVIVGHSLGGTLALAVALDAPSLVGPIVIVDSLPFLGGPVFQVSSGTQAQPMAAQMRAGMNAMTAEQYQQFSASGTATQFMVKRQADHEVVKQWMAASDPSTVANLLPDVYALDLQTEMPQITVPTLVLGTWIGLVEQMRQYNVTLTKADVTRTFATQYAGLRPLHFAMADASRHFIILDDPDWLFEQIDGFLRDPEAAIRTRGLP